MRAKSIALALCFEIENATIKHGIMISFQNAYDKGLEKRIKLNKRKEKKIK